MVLLLVGRCFKWEDEGNFFDFKLWGKRAESINPYLGKGAQIGIEGELQQDRWQDKDGNNRSKVSINVSNVQLCSKREKQESGGDFNGYKPPETVAQSGFDEDIPF